MQSVRINKKGVRIPSNIFPEHNNEYQEWWRQHQAPAVERKFLPPWDNSQDKDLTLEVSENSVVYTGKVDLYPTSPSFVKNQQNLTQRLNALARFSPGTWFCYDSYRPDTASLSLYCIHYVIAVDTSLDTVSWPTGMRPKTHLTINAGNCYLQPNLGMWCRWTDLGFIRQLTDSELLRLVVNNVQLQDFVNKTSAEYAAGTLKIES